MARYSGPKCRLCRRENEKLFLKGERCYSDKCSFERKPYGPGERTKGRRRVSEYRLQLREKEKLRSTYGLLERQFRTFYERADKQKGATGSNLLTHLERRLDNVIYRSGIGASRDQARQLILHRHFKVNGKVTNIPSFIVNAEDTIEIKEKSRKIPEIKENVESAGMDEKSVDWIVLNKDNFSMNIERLPERDDVSENIQENLVVELYSK